MPDGYEMPEGHGMKVLLCKVGGLGDTVSILPTLQALSDSGEVDITVLCAPRVADLLSQAVPGIRVVTVERAAVGGAMGMTRVPGLVQQVGRVDVALVSPDECTAIHTVAWTVASRRIGFASGISKGEGLLTDRLPFDPARPVPCLTLDLARTLFDWPQMPLERVSPFPRQRNGHGKPYGVIHPGAASALQRWDIQRFSALVDVLEGRTGFRWQMVEEESFDLVDLAALLAGAEAFVGCHSGPLQLAAALGVPWVAVCGPTAPSWDPPWTDVPGIALRMGPACQPCGRLGAPARHCQHDLVCLESVSVNAVAQTVSQLLQQAGSCPAGQTLAPC